MLNKNASLRGRRLYTFTQVRKVLLELVERKEILSFEKINNRLDSSISLSYKIFLRLDVFFNFVIRPAYSFHPIRGIEWDFSNGNEVVALIGDECRPRRIKEILREAINLRKVGAETEDFFCRDVIYLIKNDKEVGRRIKELVPAERNENETFRIDFFIVCTDKKRVPLQIKKGLLESYKHKKEKHRVPLLRYTPDLLNSGLLKTYILKICESYPEYIEYCI